MANHVIGLMLLAYFVDSQQRGVSSFSSCRDSTLLDCYANPLLSYSEVPGILSKCLN